MKKFIIIAIISIAIGIIATLGSMKLMASETYEPVIGANITVGDLDVSGMTKEEATTTVANEVNSTLATTFTLKAGDKTVEASATELGVKWADSNVIDEVSDLGHVGNIVERYKAKKDLERDGAHEDITYEVDSTIYQEYMEGQLDNLNLDAINATVKRTNGEFVIADGQTGVEVDVSGSYDAFATFIADEWQHTSQTVDLVTTIEKPRGTREELSQIQDLLGTYSTDFGKTPSGRDKNVINGASLVNGTVLYPGDEFSLTQAVSPFTFANGYDTATAYLNGKVIPSIGGGICQVSTTLYNAVLLAELEVTERYNHSMIIHYAPLSADAAIAEGCKDLKIVNNQEVPIYIEGKTYNGTITFTIYGKEVRASNRTIKYQSVTTETIPVTTTNFTQTASAIGTVSRTQGAFPGYKAQLWKVVYINGVEQSRTQINSSTYKMVAPYYDVGMASSNPEAIAAMKAAIGTGDLETVKAAAAKWSTAGLAAAQKKLEEVPDPTEPTVPEDPTVVPDSAGGSTSTDPIVTP